MSLIVVTCVGLGPTIDQLLVCTTYRTIMSTEKQACIARLPPICKPLCAHLPKFPALFYLLVFQNSWQIQGVGPAGWALHIWIPYQDLVWLVLCLPCWCSFLPQPAKRSGWLPSFLLTLLNCLKDMALTLRTFNLSCLHHIIVSIDHGLALSHSFDCMCCRCIPSCWTSSILPTSPVSTSFGGPLSFCSPHPCLFHLQLQRLRIPSRNCSHCLLQVTLYIYALFLSNLPFHVVGQCWLWLLGSSGDLQNHLPSCQWVYKKRWVRLW